MHYLGELENIMICGKYIQDNKYKILSESAWFCRRCDKTFDVFLDLQFQSLFTYEMRTLSFTR